MRASQRIGDDTHERLLEPSALVDDLVSEASASVEGSGIPLQHPVRPIDVPRSAIASDRALVGWPFSMVRRLMLRVLRPFHVQLVQQATANDLALRACIEDLERQIEAAAAELRGAQASAQDLKQQIEALAETTASGFAGVDSLFAALPEMISPTLYNDEVIAVVDGRGHPTIGYALEEAIPQPPYVHFQDSFRGLHERVAAILEPLAEQFDDADSVLDAGCGRGEFLSLLQDRGIRAVGVDIDEGMVAYALERGLQAKRGDASEYLVSHSQEFDALFSSQVIEHLDFDDLVEFLTSIRVHLRPKSKVVLETTNPYSPGGLQAFRCDPTHRSLLFPEVLIILLRACGFSSAHVIFPAEWDSYDVAKREQPNYAVVAIT